MAELTLQPNSEQWHKLRKRFLNDLFFACDVVLGMGSVVPMTVRAHLAMCRFAERRSGHKALDEKWVRFIKVPRGVGKSTCITQGYAIQLAMKHPDIAILIANETERGAMKFLSAIKTQFTDNNFLRALFPERIPADPEAMCKKWSETEVILPRETKRQEPTIMALGVGGALTGMHPDVALVDDMFSDEAMENARIGSFIIFEKINRWVDRLRPIVNTQEPHHIVNTQEPHHGVLFVGTPWWEGDSYSHVEKSFGNDEPEKEYRIKHEWEQGSVEVACRVVGDLAIFERPIMENGTSYFPERHSDEKLASMQRADPLLYAANMLLNPTAPTVVTFKPDWRRYYTWSGENQVTYKDQNLVDKYVLVEDLDLVLSIDPAFSEGGTTSSFQALVLTGGTPEGFRLILKANATRQSDEGFQKDIVQACRDFKPRKLLIERAGQQVAFINSVKNRLAAAGIFVSIEEVAPGGKSPDVRIGTLGSYFERGQIYGDRKHMHFWREYDGFPRSKFKDLLVALAYQPPFWITHVLGVRSAVAEQRIQQELERVYSQMGKRNPYAAPGKEYLRRQDGSRR